MWRDERSVNVVGPKQRTLLALLVLQANRIVPHDRLLTALWGGAIPATGRRLLHNHLWSVRRLLDDANALVGTPTGYSLRLLPGDSDLDVFLTETTMGRSAMTEEDPAKASDHFSTALALWRGPALDGTQPEFQAAEGSALEELRIATVFNRIEADLILKRHAELIGELRLLVAEHPLHEGFRGQLMRAFHRIGRTAEALEEFRIARQHFREELGLDPGEELTRIHRSILAGEPAFETTSADPIPSSPVSPSPAAPPTMAVPRQLPADIARFTGREESLRRLDLLLSADRNGASAVVITAITGIPGIGKTALATRWGHRVADRFPDGQLYVNLHGYSQGEPVTGTQALHQLLRGLGVAADQIPHEVDERTSMYRSLLADRRMLVVLDNAARPEQIRPLLPGSSLCKVVITSRDSLRGLTATHDVDTLTLDLLSPDEAKALLIAVLGKERVRDQADAVLELAHLCGYLPLALRLAAAHLVSQPTLPIADFAARLLRENRLTALDIEEDPHIGVRAAFMMSYGSLPETARRIFRSLGIHPGPDIGIDEVIALTGSSIGAVNAALNTLIGAHLVQHGTDGRFVVHDLVSLFARERGESEDTETIRHGALIRLFDWYLHTARAAMKQVHVDHSGIKLVSEPPSHGIPAFGDYDSATSWLDIEYPALIAAVNYAASHGWPDYAWQIAYTLDYFFYLRDRTDDWLTIHQTALSAVREAGDQHGEGRILNALGAANMFSGKINKCIEYQRQALDISRTIGDRKDEGYALGRIGYSLLWTGDFHQAIKNCLTATELFHQLDDEHGEVTVLFTLGIAYLRIGRSLDALQCLEKCLTFDRKTGSRNDEAYTLTLLGDVHESLGDLGTALEFQQRSIQLNREVGNRRLEANAMSSIGKIFRQQGQHTEAIEQHSQALIQIREVGDHYAECEILMDLGTALLETGDKQAALESQHAALDIAITVKDRYRQGLARNNLAHALHALGRTEGATNQWRTAFDILSPMGVPEVREIAQQTLGASALTTRLPE
ncbi:tetratricopeptide repeat protein [Streptosporangium sp. NBC_01495]|uniref:AfsR/SARP family transcriptional regulator n=1 Tax=Streptosporangium sp. NBC_01495 TaxID=2903899 RepID=UPI002E359A73|nr:BTAD domain-containing putative transcriptional regulator [Streptosporangium sp. NBC_01495]